MKARLEWKVQDCWIGAYWDRGATHWHLWVCLLPMLPVHFWWPHARQYVRAMEALLEELGE